MRAPAAASSTARGRLSTRSQISRVASTFAASQTTCRPDCPDTFDEERCCVREWWDPVFALALESQRLSARRKHLQAGGVFEQDRDSSGAALSRCSKLSSTSSSCRLRTRCARAAAGSGPKGVKPIASAMAIGTRSGSSSRSRGTSPSPSRKRGASTRAASTASRVLPIPPRPVSVTRRASSRSVICRSSANSLSRPMKEVVRAGSPDRASGSGSGSPEWKRSVRRSARSSVHERSKLFGGPERAVRGSLPDALQKRVQQLFSLGRRLLDIEQHRLPRCKRRTRPRYPRCQPRSDPPVALPVDTEEDVALREVRRIQVARRMRPRALLEEDRRQPQRRDRLTNRRTLEGKLAKRRRDEDP